MKITFLGSGSAFVSHKHNYQTNVLIEYDNNKLLIDAGDTILPALEDAGYSPRDITDVFITHCHGDHIHGLEALGFINHFNGSVFGGKPINVITQWDIATKVRESLIPSMSHTSQGFKSMSAYFNFIPIEPWDKHFLTKNIQINSFKTTHVQEEPSIGVHIKVGSKLITYTSDVNVIPYEHIKSSSIIFHDCEFADYPGSVHTQYNMLCKLDEYIKNKMWLMHSNVEITEELQQKVKNDGFLGVVVRGQVFEVNE